MKVRDSGMPEQSYWESLFDVSGIMDGLKIDGVIRDAVELGCGYGTFTIPTAQRISGTLHAFDIDPTMTAATRERLAAADVSNVRVSERDVIAGGFGLPPGAVDAVLLFNILHAVDPVHLLEISANALRSGGRILVIHWRSDIPTPRGPDLAIRPRPHDVHAWAQATGHLRVVETRLLPPWHFGVALSLSTAGEKQRAKA